MLYARDQITPFLVFESNWGLNPWLRECFLEKKKSLHTVNDIS